MMGQVVEQRQPVQGGGYLKHGLQRDLILIELSEGFRHVDVFDVGHESLVHDGSGLQSLGGFLDRLVVNAIRGCLCIHAVLGVYCGQSQRRYEALLRRRRGTAAGERATDAQFELGRLPEHREEFGCNIRCEESDLHRL